MAIPIRKKLADDIADYLIEKIIRMEIAPGQRIVEADVAKDFAVSHGPVREALIILDKYHLVELIPRRGARVKELSITDIRCLFEIMTEITGLVASLCSKNRSQKELDNLLTLGNKAVELASIEDINGYFVAIYDFSLASLSATKNHLLAQIIHDWIPCLRRAYFISISHSSINLKESARVLRNILTHIEKENSSMARLTIQQYFKKEEKRILHIISEYMENEDEMLQA